MKIYFSKILFIFVFLFSIQTTLALTQLPKNSFLQFNDNQKEVKILQEILNSDPSTMVATTGVGSPGFENWYFGLKTQDAVKRFQKKYNIFMSGKIDLNTLKKLNEIASNTTVNIKTNISNMPSISNSKIQPINSPIEEIEENIYLDDETNTPPTQAIPPKPKTVAKATTTQPTYLDSIINKYLNFLKPTSSGNISEFSSTTPVYSPNMLPRDQYSQAPISQTNPSYYSSVGIGQNSGGASSQRTGNYSGNGIDKYSSGLPFGGAGATIPNNSKSGEPLNNLGAITGVLRDIGIGRATTFAHGSRFDNCVADAHDQQNNQRSASGVVLSRAGLKAIPAVALPSPTISRYGKGTPVEVLNTKTGICKVFPLLDSGPSAVVLAKGVVIDLTGSAYDLISNIQPCDTVSNIIKGPVQSIQQVKYAINTSAPKMSPGQIGECTMLVK